MEKFYNLSASPYREVNAIRVYSAYDKRAGGYTLTAEPITRGDGMISKCYCPEYFNHGGDFVKCTIPASRQSERRKAEAEEYCRQHAREIAEKYLQYINTIGKTDIHITEEA